MTISRPDHTPADSIAVSDQNPVVNGGLPFAVTHTLSPLLSVCNPWLQSGQKGLESEPHKVRQPLDAYP
jgi:hypothetical protein